MADDDTWAAGLVGHGVPETQAEMLLGMFRASRRGEFATVDPTLTDLLGRPPHAVRSVLEGSSPPADARVDRPPGRCNPGRSSLER